MFEKVVTLRCKDGSVFTGSKKGDDKCNLVGCVKRADQKMYEGEVVLQKKGDETVLKMIEGTMYYTCRTKRFVGKFLDNAPSDGFFLFTDGCNSQRLLPR